MVEVAGLREGSALKYSMDDSHEASRIQAGMLPGEAPGDPLQECFFDPVLIERTRDLRPRRERSFALPPAAEVAGTPVCNDEKQALVQPIAPPGAQIVDERRVDEVFDLIGRYEVMAQVDLSDARDDRVGDRVAKMGAGPLRQLELPLSLPEVCREASFWDTSTDAFRDSGAS